MTESLSLRPYQALAIERIREHIRRGVRTIVVASPTGSGKTVVAAAIVASAYAKGRRAIFVAHRRELLAQSRRKLIDAGIAPSAIGMVAGGEQPTPDAPIQVVSIDAYRHREPPEADVVIIDEAHRSLSPSYLALIARYSGAGAVVLGLTATPYRRNGDGLGEIYSALEVVAHPSDLVAAGFIVRPRIYGAVGQPDLSNVSTVGGDYAERELSDAMLADGLVGDIVKTWQRLAGGRRTVCFASSIEHSQAIAAAFVGAGVRAEHVDGTTPSAERDRILGRLETGETSLVSNCGVLAEGWDQPSCKCAILARPTKSLGLYLQQAGRILRPWQGVEALILGHAGCALEFGFPTDDRAFTLEKMPKHVGDAAVKACPSCRAVIAAGCVVCPECNAEFPRPERMAAGVASPGELRELIESEQLMAADAERRARGLCSTKQSAQLRKRGLNGDCSFAEAQLAMAHIVANRWRTPPWLKTDPRFALPIPEPTAAEALTCAIVERACASDSVRLTKILDVGAAIRRAKRAHTRSTVV